MDAHAGYLAGLIDGEGHISLLLGADGRSIRSGLAIANTSREMLEWLQTHNGGRIYPIQRLLGYRPVWVWRVSGHEAVGVIIAARPYLIAKASQADVFLRFALTLTRSGKRIDSDTQRLRVELCETMRTLNRRGLRDSATSRDVHPVITEVA